MKQPKAVKLLAPALGVVALALPAIGNAQGTVLAGWDLLSTVPSHTVFMGQNWEGVPIGPYDFGPGIGVQNVGIADTIIQRSGTATERFGGPPSIVPIEIVALQLQSVNPFDPDGVGPAPLGIYYLSLNNVVSGGSVSIGFDNPLGGTFNNQFPVSWKMTLGSLGGPPLAQGVEQFQLDPAPGYWGHDKVSPGAGVPLIPGVNYLLNHTDTAGDLHFAFNPFAADGEPGGHGGVPSGPHIGADSPWYTDKALAAAIHGVTECPEPSDWALLSALGLGGFALYRRTRRA